MRMMRMMRRRQMKNVLSAVRAPQTFGPFNWQLSVKMVWTNQTTDWSSIAPPPDDPQRPPEVSQGSDVDSDSGVVEQVQTTCHMRPSDELRPETRSTRMPHPVVVVMMFPMSLCCPVTHRRAKIRTENREKLKWTTDVLTWTRTQTCLMLIVIISDLWPPAVLWVPYTFTFFTSSRVKKSVHDI